MNDPFKHNMDLCKQEIAATLQRLAHAGVPTDILMAAMGSSTGILVGILMGTDDAEALGKMIEAMRPAMVKDAQAVFSLRKN